jgi:hypothetical protein
MKLAIVSMLMILATVTGQTSSEVLNVSLDQEFTIRIDQVIKINLEKLHIKFTSVLEDSRCPKGEQCMTQGNGKIELELILEEKESSSVSLNTAPGLSEVDYHGYTVHLISLNPYPVMNQDVRPEDYEAVLEVTLTNNREQ